MPVKWIARHIILTLVFGIGWMKNGMSASLNLNPIGFSLSTQRASGVLQITNTGDDPVRVQVSAVDWGHDGHEEVLADTDDLLLNPPIFSLTPGQIQYLRFGLRHSPKTPTEKSYRLIVDEVPANETPATGLRMLLRISIPVFITPQEQQEKVTWELRQESTGVVLTARNDGNLHIKIHQLKLRGEDDQQDVLIATPTYILSGQHKEWLLENGKIRAGKFHLHIQTDKGEIEENLTLVANQIRSHY